MPASSVCTPGGTVKDPAVYRDMQVHAMGVLSRAVNDTSRDGEYVIPLGDMVQITWVDDKDSTIVWVCNLYLSDMHPFAVD